MTLTEQARRLYIALEQKRRTYAVWCEKAERAGDQGRAYELRQLLVKIDRIADKALDREIRREDKKL